MYRKSATLGLTQSVALNKSVGSPSEGQLNNWLIRLRSIFGHRSPSAGILLFWRMAIPFVMRVFYNDFALLGLNLPRKIET